MVQINCWCKKAKNPQIKESCPFHMETVLKKTLTTFVDKGQPCANIEKKYCRT
jgi:hypothetical protein